MGLCRCFWSGDWSDTTCSVAAVDDTNYENGNVDDEDGDNDDDGDDD